MDIPPEITFLNMDTSEALERKIRDRVARLEEHYGKYVKSCRVAMEVPHRSPAGHALGYHVRIEVHVPEKELVVSRDPGDNRAHFDAHVAVRDAFDAMERQIDEYADLVRHDVKAHAVPPQGKVLRLFPDHGFIVTNDGLEIYFHRNAVFDARFEDLRPGMPVELSIIEGESPMGPQATTVRPIRPLEFVPEPIPVLPKKI